MKGKRVPTYDLSEIQRQVRLGNVQITVTARRAAANLGFDENDITTCVLRLVPTDFYKSMESETMNGLWQDVYRPLFLTLPLYVKLQLAATGSAIVISFKEL